MSDQEQMYQQTAAFQKIWAESLTKLMQTAMTFGPDSAPREVLQQIRGGIFQALAKAWEEFMRSPQFLDSMRQWMESAVTFRKMTNDFLSKARNDMQAPSRQDIDTVILALRHMEKRLLDRTEELSREIEGLKPKKESARAGRKQRRVPRSRAAAKR